MSSGKYEEPLSAGGTLRVSPGSWEINYYFPGPDLRYNGRFVTVPGAQIETFIEAYEANFKEFEALRASIPAGGSFQKAGACGMTINVGGHWNGVCIQGHHMPLKTREQISRVVGEYRRAAERAAQVQKFLVTLG